MKVLKFKGKKKEDRTLQELGADFVADYFYRESQRVPAARKVSGYNSDDLRHSQSDSNFNERLDQRDLAEMFRCSHCGDPTGDPALGFCSDFCRKQYSGKRIRRIATCK